MNMPASEWWLIWCLFNLAYASARGRTPKPRIVVCLVIAACVVALMLGVGFALDHIELAWR